MRINSYQDYQNSYQDSIRNPEKFWQDKAEKFVWRRKWSETLKWDFKKPDIKWFVNGKLNITENCLDRHLQDKGSQVAILWEPNDPNLASCSLTYQELYNEVNRCANAFKELGIKKGDRICFYMPMVPELAIGVLACARIGAIHSVVFAGFSANALADRIKDAQCNLVICSDYSLRGTKNIPIKCIVDEALGLGCDCVQHVLVHKNTAGDISWNESKDVWWHEIVDKQSSDFSAVEMDSEDLLFILYTSGSTGKPKGVVHTCGGYMVYSAYSFQNVFQYEKGDIYWCTADIGWITGHSYIIYGPLLSGATTIMFEGIPTYPNAGRFWDICQKYRVNQFYTAPTAIRALMAIDDNMPDQYDLSSLKTIGSVGEPINEEAWNWYNEKVGRKRCAIVDTWWQTETGGIMISPLPNITDTKPCYASYPLPGVQPCLVDVEGKELHGNNIEGLLCIKFPWPSILRTTYGDHERCRQTYFSVFKNLYFTGDGAKRDDNGRYRIIGRVDDVINVSGHRIGTAEIENAINEYSGVVESAVVGFPHKIKGQGIYAYVIVNDDVDEENINEKIAKIVSKVIGSIAKPDKVQVVAGLPKTRSGKIMRRILRKIANGEDNFGDISTLLNPEIVKKIQKGAKKIL